MDALLAELADGAESAYDSTNVSFISQNVELMNSFDEVCLGTFFEDVSLNYM